MSQPVGFDLAESILANNVRTTVLGHKGFAVKYKYLYLY